MRLRRGVSCFSWQRNYPWQQLRRVDIKATGYDYVQNIYLLFFVVKDAAKVGMKLKTERWVLIERLRREWLKHMEREAH